MFKYTDYQSTNTTAKIINKHVIHPFFFQLSIYRTAYAKRAHAILDFFTTAPLLQ